MRQNSVLQTIKSHPLVVSFYSFIAMFIVIFGEPLLLGPIVLLRGWFGFWVGYLVFLFAWWSMGVIIFFLYTQGLRVGLVGKFLDYLDKEIKSLGGVDVGALDNDHQTRGVLGRVRLFIANFGLDRVFVIVILGPVFGIPIMKSWGWQAKKADVIWKFFFVALIFCSIWYFLYAGVVWAIIRELIRLIF